VREVVRVEAETEEATAVVAMAVAREAAAVVAWEAEAVVARAAAKEAVRAAAARATAERAAERAEAMGRAWKGAGAVSFRRL
jgi:hypothetical protein